MSPYLAVDTSNIGCWKGSIVFQVQRAGTLVCTATSGKPVVLLLAE
jgi:hypothetical protein